MQRDEKSSQIPELKFFLGRSRETDVYVAGYNYTFPNLYVGDKLVKRGLDLALYPNRYQSYSRSYVWRIRKQGALVTLSISYDNGNTFETFLDWKSGSEFEPAFGVSCKNATLVLDRIQLKIDSE